MIRIKTSEKDGAPIHHHGDLGDGNARQMSRDFKPIRWQVPLGRSLVGRDIDTTTELDLDCQERKGHMQGASHFEQCQLPSAH